MYDRPVPPPAHSQLPRARLLFLLGAACALAACGQGVKLLPRDSEVTKPDSVGPPPGCKDLPTARIQTWRHKGTDVSFTVAGDATLKDVPNIGKRGALEAAATVDWTGGFGDVSGLVFSRQAFSGDAAHQVVELMALLRKELGSSSVTVRWPGSAGVSPGGHPMIRGFLVDLTVSGYAQINYIRNYLFPWLMGGDPGRFGTLFQEHQAGGQAFVLAGSVMLRRSRGQLIFSGGVATRNDHDIRTSAARVRAADLSSGAAVASHAATTSGRCDDLTLVSASKVDFLWVIDEGAELQTTRLALHASVTEMWIEAQKLGLDFRMAVLGMGRIEDGGSSVMNGLCKGAEDKTGAFWYANSSGNLPAQLQTCLLGPSNSYRQGSGSHGLRNLRQALVGMLPRKAGDATRLLPGAKTVILLVSDRPPEVINKAFGGSVPPTPFSPVQAQRVQDAIAPFMRLLQGDGQKETAAIFPGATGLAELKGSLVYALTTQPEAGCGKEHRGTGYIELASAVGGGVRLICQNTGGFEPLLAGVTQDVARRARPLSLQGRVLPASLAAAMNVGGLVPLSRSRRQGFDYHAASSSLLIYDGAGSALVGDLRASYLIWGK